MFCPKCGTQNVDESKFCRGCGADLSNVLAVVDGKPRPFANLEEKYIEVYSRGARGLMLGIGFMIISGIVFTTFTPRGWVLAIFALVFAVVFLASGLSRFIQARAMRALTKRDDRAALPVGQAEYITPMRSTYETEDLIARPLSVTENTTRHLELDADATGQNRER
jgi:hypothetical protein